MGAVFRRVVPFFQRQSFSRPESGEAESIQTIPITAPKCLLEGGHLRSGEDGEGAFTDSCAIEGRGLFAWHQLLRKERSRAGTLTRRASAPRGLAGL